MMAWIAGIAGIAAMALGLAGICAAAASRDAARGCASFTQTLCETCGRIIQYEPVGCYDGPYRNVGWFVVQSETGIEAGSYEFAAGEITCCSGTAQWGLARS